MILGTYIRLCGLLGLSLGMVGSGGAQTHRELPSPTGPHPVGRATFVIGSDVQPTLSTEERAVMVVLWYPATSTDGEVPSYLVGLDARREILGSEFVDAAREVIPHARTGVPVATEGAPFALVTLSHSLGGLPGLYTGLAEDLASHGYIVAAVGHPGGSRALWLDGEVVPLSEAWQENDPSEVGLASYLSFREERARVWLEDALLTIRRLPSQRIGGRPLGEFVDTSRVGYVGHSIGGTAAALGCAVTPIFDACVNLDGWPLPSEAEDGFDRPFLHIEETRPYRPQAQLDGWGATRGEYDQNMWALAARKDSVFQALDAVGYHLVVDGLAHSGFSDLPLWSRSDAESQSISPTRGLTVLRTWVGWFLDAHVRGISETAPPSPTAFPDVRFTAYGSEWSQDRPNRRE